MDKYEGDRKRQRHRQTRERESVREREKAYSYIHMYCITGINPTTIEQTSTSNKRCPSSWLEKNQGHSV